VIQYEGGTEAAGRTYVTGDPQGHLDAIAAESTSAALARVERERDELVAEVERLVDLGGKALRERDLARAELASARQELDALRTVRDQLGRDLTEANSVIEQLRLMRDAEPRSPYR
jgi:chromosome segregation ATPase